VYDVPAKTQRRVDLLLDLPALASQAGGQNLQVVIGLQDLSQARTRWGQDAADGFLSLFQTKLILTGIADDNKGTVWIIDAKNANPTNDQLNKTQAQIRLLQKAPELTNGRAVTGVIVHHRRQLDSTPQSTEHRDILRATLQGLPDLLLAKRLPAERPRQKTQQP
jgi:hypothetical protein